MCCCNALPQRGEGWTWKGRGLPGWLVSALPSEPQPAQLAHPTPPMQGDACAVAAVALGRAAAAAQRQPGGGQGRIT